MNQADKRTLENELFGMGLPAVDDPAFLPVFAGVVNAYPYPQERVEFFCDMLNECEAGKRKAMYEAMRPHLHFDVPAFDVCEGRIAMKAERMIRPNKMGKTPVIEEVPVTILALECGGCEQKDEFTGLTTADAMCNAKKAGWGRGPVAGKEFCPQCRADALISTSLGKIYTRRHNALATV